MRNKTALILGFSLIAVFGVIFFLVAYGITSGYDTSAFNFINQSLNVPALNSFFVAVAIYGREFFWIPVVALLWFFGKKNGRKTALIMVIVFIAIIIIGEGLKAGYYRARPWIALPNAISLGPHDTDSSFPSGHALIVVAGATIALLMLKKRYSIPLLVEALVVCYSRLYVGAHYPTDVLAGAALGAGVALVLFYILSESKKFGTLFESINNFYTGILKRIGIKSSVLY